MRVETRTLYSSPNGDEWHLARDSDSGEVFIVHRPNAASGGKSPRIDVGSFLSLGGGRGPEHQELLRLIGTLVEQ